MPNQAWLGDASFLVFKMIIIGFITIGFAGFIYIVDTVDENIMPPIFIGIVYGVGLLGAGWLFIVSVFICIFFSS